MAVSILSRGGRFTAGQRNGRSRNANDDAHNLVAQTRLSIQRIYQVLAMRSYRCRSLTSSRKRRALPLRGELSLSASAYWRRVAGGELYVPAGQIVALVGPSGAGKSTWRACCCVTPTRTKAISVLAAGSA